MAFIGQTTLGNTPGNPLPTVGEGEWIMRRILKFLEAQGAADAQQRQRVTIDAITGALTLTTVTTVSTVTTLSTVTNPVPVGNIATIAGMGDEQYINVARNAFANSIRNRLTTSGPVSGP